jgi:uncharacterized protein (DUF1501 family)
MNRRDALKLFSLAPMSLAAQHLHAAEKTQTAPSVAKLVSTGSDGRANRPRLLVVFMRGGYDAANLLIPTSSSFYYESRPNIAVAKPDDKPTSAIALNADWGLHPALRDNVYSLYQKGEALFIPFAGTDDMTRSHFETQDSIELGQALNASRNYDSGFLNRLAAVLTEKGGSMQPVQRMHPIAFTDQVSHIFRGDLQIPNMALKSLNKPGIDARQSVLIASMYKNTALENRVSEGFAVRDEVMKEMAAEMDAASRNAITAKGFELEARRIAKLMRDQFNIGFVDVGGWDTHVAEGGGTGYLAGRFEELGRGLAGFADEMGSAWKDTVVVVLSEFGRTFRENGNRGTDHGHGSVYWVLGGGIKGGRVAGEQIAVDRASLLQDRDYKVINEYRTIFGGLFSRMYGLTPAQSAKVFAGVAPKDFGIV